VGRVEVPELTGGRVRLEPLSLDHAADLAEAGREDRATYAFTWVPDGPAGVDAYLASVLGQAEAGELVPFAQVRLVDGRAVGATSYGNLRPWPDGSGLSAVEVGWTWLAGSAQRTPINTESKLLMMTHAFEVWRVHRVALQTDVRNARSRAAIERIGGQLDGIMRADRPGADDTVRTSARFSIVASEWPDVKAQLAARLPGGSTVPRPWSGGSSPTSGPDPGR